MLAYPERFFSLFIGEEGVDLREIETVKGEKLIHLTTKGRRTGKPHTVPLWFAFADGRIYLSHEGRYTDWMKNIMKDGRVEARIREVRFKALARILGEGSPRERGKGALYEKYYGPGSKEVIDDWFSLSAVLELTPF